MWYLAFWIFFVNELGLWVEVEAPPYNTPGEVFTQVSG
jgi:hypothetical protein